MSFQEMTSVAQAMLDDYKNTPVDEEMMEEIKDIIFEYCQDVEMEFGIEMGFKVWTEEGRPGIRYKIEPKSELDAVLLKHTVENAERVAPFVPNFH